MGHIVVAESIEDQLFGSLRQIQHRRRPTLRSDSGRQQLWPPTDQNDFVEQDVFEELFQNGVFAQRRTFLCVASRLQAPSAVTQSTTQHYHDSLAGPRNPRRHTPRIVEMQ